MRCDLVRVYTPTFTRLHVFPAGLVASCMGGARPFFSCAPPIQEVFSNQTTSGPRPLYLLTTMQRATQAKAGVMNGEYRGLTAGIISKFIISFVFEPSLSEVSQGIDTRGYMYIIDGQRHCTF